MTVIRHLKGSFAVRADCVDSTHSVSLVVSVLAVAKDVLYRWCIAASTTSSIRVGAFRGTAFGALCGVAMVLALAGVAVGMFVVRMRRAVGFAAAVALAAV